MKINNINKKNLVGYWTLNQNDAITTAIKDKSGNGNDGTSANTPVFTYNQNSVPNQGFVFNGTSDEITIGNVGNIKTFAIWIYPTAHTKNIVDFNATTYIDINSSTEVVATNFTTPTYYVNGIESQQLVLNNWNHITVTDGTSVNASALVLGRDVTWFTGNMSDGLTYTSEITENQVRQLYLAGRTTAEIKIDTTNTNYIALKLQKGLILDMPLAEPYTEGGGELSSGLLIIGHKYVITARTDGDFTAVGSPDNNVGTTFSATATGAGLLDAGDKVKEIDGITKDKTPYGNDGTVSGAIIKYDGLVNAGAGIAYINQDKAYGTWEFDVNKGADGNVLTSIFISEVSDETGNNYFIQMDNLEKILLYKYDGTTYTNLFYTAASYMAIDTDYRIKITRSLAGVFTVYIKGGSFGWDDWTTVDVSGGGGTNPVTDNTHTTSNYLVADLDDTDTISNLKIDGKRHRLNNATQSTGTWTTTAGAYDFDGTDDYIDLGTDKPTDLTGDITISAWINAESYGEGNEGRIIDNGKLSLWYNIASEGIRFWSDGSSLTSGASSAVSFNVWHHIIVTRPSAGTNTNFYINGTLSGTVNQDSGTPVAGTTNTFIGNRNANDRTFDGQIKGLKIYNRILSTSEISYLFAKERINCNV